MHQNLRVSVSGWNNRRQVIIQEEKVLFEIAMGHNHCPTCSKRMRDVTEQLARRNVQYSWDYKGNGAFLVLQAPGEGLSVQEYLSGLLNLTIN